MTKEIDLSIPTLFLSIIIFIGLIILLFGGVWASVPAGHIGVQDRFGQVQSQGLQPGFYWKDPFLGIIPLSIQTKVYTTDAISASKDLQDVKTQVALNYRLDAEKVIQIYKTIGKEFGPTIIIPAVQESVKAGTAKFTADELITRRSEVKQAIQETLEKRLVEYGIIVETISITNFEFSAEFTKAIESKVSAEQSALQAQNKLKQVEIEAQQRKAEAQGIAEATKLKADADAYALRVISTEIEKNNRLIEYRTIEKWDGMLPKVTGTTNPLIDIGQITQ